MSHLSEPIPRKYTRCETHILSLLSLLPFEVYVDFSKSSARHLQVKVRVLFEKPIQENERCAGWTRLDLFKDSPLVNIRSVSGLVNNGISIYLKNQIFCRVQWIRLNILEILCAGKLVLYFLARISLITSSHGEKLLKKHISWRLLDSRVLGTHTWQAAMILGFRGNFSSSHLRNALKTKSWQLLKQHSEYPPDL